MKPNISEFSYGFALTSELVQTGPGVTAAPVFPSLIEEGQPGGGWDVRLDRPGLPLFLQFKLCDWMKTKRCREHQLGGLNVPCYRMHLRPTSVSQQHPMLLALEQTGQEVYYSAPIFHQPDELNAAFLANSVRARSVWIRPSDIGPLPDNDDHHVSFEPGGPCVLFSEPRKIRNVRTFESMWSDLESQLRARGKTRLGDENFEELADSIERIAFARPDIGERQKHLASAVARPASPLRAIAYYASVFLESQLFVVQERAGV